MSRREEKSERMRFGAERFVKQFVYFIMFLLNEFNFINVMNDFDSFFVVVVVST